MTYNLTEGYREEHQSLQQAFTTLLILVEALSGIADQAADALSGEEDHAEPICIAAAGKSLAEITRQVLDCYYVGVMEIEPPDDHQRLLGVSGLTPEQAQHYKTDADRRWLTDYLNAAAIAQLRADRVILLDLKDRPFTTPRPTFGARYRLIAPMILYGRLMGLFTIAKTDAVYPDIQSAYTQQEIALAKGVAKLAAQVFERVRFFQERAVSHAYEQALQADNRRYDEFLALASHELRNPLTSIKGNAQLSLRHIKVLEHQERPEASIRNDLQCLQHRLEGVVQNSDKLERMIGELLDFSRIQAKRLVMAMRPCDLRKIVQQAVEDIQHVAPERTILLSLPLEKAVPIVADEDRIGQVVSNYLTNALKYSPADRPIEVNLGVEEELVRVSVRDEGPGLFPEEQAHIWERFYRAPNVAVLDSKRGDANLGLGLHLCKEILERHYGHVGVDSIPGQGSTFWFTLARSE